MKEKITNVLQFLKNNWSGLLKFLILTYTMTMGFNLTYLLIWVSVGLPQADWALWLIGTLAVASEIAYLEWVKRT